MATYTVEEALVMDEPAKEALQFDVIIPGDVSPEVQELMQHIQEVAESLLYHWKNFPIVLPPSLTSQGYEKIDYRDLFKAPTFDELEQVATDTFGDLKKLGEWQLKSVWERGQFEVPSFNFPGQSHTWRVTRLLQKGTQNANESLLGDMALALRLLIITAKNRFTSNTFSLSQSLKSWGTGVWKLMDIVFGMPSTGSGDLASKMRSERQKYLIAELDIKPSHRHSFAKFSQFVIDYSRLSPKERFKRGDVNPPPIPYIYQTPKGQDIDLRLLNKDVLNHCLPVLSNILDRESQGWYINYRHKLILKLKGDGLTNEEISKRVNEMVKEEYLHRVYKAILNNAELESVEVGIGAVLVQQAKAVMLMKKAILNIETKMQSHKGQLLAHLKKAYPVKSRINDWVNEQAQNFEREFVLHHMWSAHEDAISLTEEDEDLHQTAYFLRRDYNFMKQREPVLLKELEKVRVPNRVFVFHMITWLPGNWVTVKCVDGEETVVPTQLVNEVNQLRALPKTGDVRYYITKETKHKNSTSYPMWRWLNYFQRTWAWTWNSMFFFGLVIPWCSPVSLRALVFPRPFMPNRVISDRDGKMYLDESSTTHTFVSRLAAIWNSVSKSRTDFETAPDRGFLGKGVTRHLNRFWNYFVKGVCGSVLLVVSFPALCVVTSTSSLCLAILAPVWMPVMSLLFHCFCFLVYDIDSPGNQNKICILLDVVLWRFLVLGTIQPIAATLFGFVACPLTAMAISLFGVLRRGLRGLWDTAMYNIVIKSRARVPASDGFVARRTAGPGLASNYFFQIQPAQALAALEATMETEELEMYKARTTDLLEKPVRHFRSFVTQVFQPFSATLMEGGTYKHLQAETANYKTDLTNQINQRQWRLNTGLNYDLQTKVKLPERELKQTIYQAACMLEMFYPGHVINQLSVSEDKFWESKGLQFRDWKGLASQKLSGIFSPSFLVPLEETDSHFQLQVKHVNLNRYVQMIEAANVHDDLDIVTEVHSDSGEILTHAPSLDVTVFNPTETIVSTNHYETLRSRRFFQVRHPVYEFDKLPVPLPVPHPSVIAMTIFNRENEVYDSSRDETLYNLIIKGIKTYKGIADPTTSVSVEGDLEPSSPENGLDPVSVVSHLAEQEDSISDISHDETSSIIHDEAGSGLVVSGDWRQGQKVKLGEKVTQGQKVESHDDADGTANAGGSGQFVKRDTGNMERDDDDNESVYV